MPPILKTHPFTGEVPGTFSPHVNTPTPPPSPVSPISGFTATPACSLGGPPVPTPFSHRPTPFPHRSHTVAPSSLAPWFPFQTSVRSQRSFSPRTLPHSWTHSLGEGQGGEGNSSVIVFHTPHRARSHPHRHRGSHFKTGVRSRRSLPPSPEALPHSWIHSLGEGQGGEGNSSVVVWVTNLIKLRDRAEPLCAISDPLNVNIDPVHRFRIDREFGEMHCDRGLR